MFRIIMLFINSKSLPWYLGKGDFKQRREEAQRELWVKAGISNMGCSITGTELEREGNSR